VSLYQSPVASGRGSGDLPKDPEQRDTTRQRKIRG